MNCIILAAGYATRLYPLTENFPKPLLPVGGKPILDWLAEDIESSVNELAVVTNHKFAERFNQWAMNAATRIGKQIRIIDDGTCTNEGRLGAVRDIELAVKVIGEDDSIVMAGDNVLDFSLKPFIGFAGEKKSSCVMCHEEKRLDALQRTAVITVDEFGMITSYTEKPREPKGTLAVPPFYIYQAGDIARIPEALKAGCNPDAPGSFAAWLAQQTAIHAYRMPGRRWDIGDMASYQTVRDSYKGPVH